MARPMTELSLGQVKSIIGIMTALITLWGCSSTQYVSKYGRPLSAATSSPASVTIEPNHSTNAVNTPQMVKAIVKDARGKPVSGAMVEWMLARTNGAVGDIIDVEQDPWKRALKMTNTYALAGADRRGEAAITISSAQEGPTHIIAVVPDIKDTTKNKAFAVFNWLDATWEFPSDTTHQLGSPKILETTVVKTSTGEPLPGYEVKWTVTSGPATYFEESGQAEVITETDEHGIARATLTQQNPESGESAVHISIIKPAEPQRICCPAVSGLIAEGGTAVKWVSPTLKIHQNCPTFSVINQPTSLSFFIVNSSSVEARDVVVTSTLSPGWEYLSSSPESLVRGNTLTWNTGLLPGNEKTQEVTLQLKPTQAGKLSHHLSVTTGDGYTATSVCETVIGQPLLSLTQTCPAEGIVSDRLIITTTVKNTGTSDARDIRVVNSVPEGFRHASGKQDIIRNIGTLAPGETKTESFEYIIERTGTATSVARVEGQGIREETTCEIALHEPGISITKTAPERRFLHRPVPYEITVSNPGTASALEVIVNDTLPSGVQYENSNPPGTFNSATNGITWNLGSLAPGASQTLTINGLAVTPGRHCNAATVKTKRALRDSAQACTDIEGVAALLIEVTDSDDPVEVGSTTTYTIVITNQGTATTTNLKISARLPETAEYVSSTGSAARLIVMGKRVDFDPIQKLEPKKAITLTVTIRGTQPGDERFHVIMEADQLTSPVIEEESTKFYQ